MVKKHDFGSIVSLMVIAGSLIGLLVISALPAAASGLKLGEICRLKGQEVNTLQGVGLVVGLRGTGDPDSAPTARALAQMMKNMGAPMGMDQAGAINLEDVDEAKNVAMVFVTARVPAVGAQPGDLLDVTVNAIGAKSLEGGTLMLTPMLGPRADNKTVYAMARGPLNISLDGPVTSAKIEGGAKMETTVRASYQLNGMITLVLDRDFASFDTAQIIEEEVNTFSQGFFDNARSPGDVASPPRARAIDQLHVQVAIPESYRENPIKYIAVLLSIPIRLNNHSNRVVINEREGVVVIGRDVEIAPVLVTHRNLRIEAGIGSGLVPISEKSDDVGNAKLKSLADALNALDVPTEDLIAIIKTLKRKGDLYGEVVFQ